MYSTSCTVRTYAHCKHSKYHYLLFINVKLVVICSINVKLVLSIKRKNELTTSFTQGEQKLFLIDPVWFYEEQTYNVVLKNGRLNKTKAKKKKLKNASERIQILSLLSLVFSAYFSHRWTTAVILTLIHLRDRSGLN